MDCYAAIRYENTMWRYGSPPPSLPLCSVLISLSCLLFSLFPSVQDVEAGVDDSPMLDQLTKQKATMQKEVLSANMRKMGSRAGDLG